jgi:hypothetical protein
MGESTPLPSGSASFVTTNAPPPWWNTQECCVASTAVDVSKLDVSLAAYLRTVGKLHRLLFGKAMLITSGNDGNHVAHSAHYLNFAADIRSRDLNPDEQMLFGIVLSYMAKFYDICVFDERATPGQHWHVQTAASAGA